MSDSTKFGRYEVEEEVARGGMGVIYRVRDPQMRRFLAMKVLLSEVEEDNSGSGTRHSKLSARFTDEAQLTGQLDHPGIIPVYDMGQDEEGRHFFTMRLVKGRTLEEIFDLVREGREGWTVTRALGVLQKVCEAMGFAHSRGVIHRDLKPANVMVGRFGETYVMDWGLAKLVDEEDVVRPVEQTTIQTILSSTRKEESGQSSDLATIEGDVMGTPAYMAPEQARGQLDRVGPPADVYALGAMLYHLLAGNPPYRPAGESLGGREVLKRVLAGPPQALGGAAPDAAPELCAISERAMAREVEVRYAGMLEMAEDLQAYVENRVVHAYRRGAVIEFKKWIQRNRTIAASLAALFVVVIVGLASVSYIQTKARTEVETANRVLEATNEELEAERSRTAKARDAAESNLARAVESESVALENEKEALWQSYVGNIGAAYAALEVGSASEARRRLAACPEPLRGWEWSYLDQRADGSLRVLVGSETFLRTLSVSQASPLVAAAGTMLGNTGVPDYAIRIWNFESGELEQVLEGHDTTVKSLAFSPSGEVLASSDSRGKLRLWNVEGGELIAEADGLGSRVAYHPDGRFIVAAQADGNRVVLWDSYDLRLVRSAELPAGTNGVRFSPDGESLALAGKDHHIRVLDMDLNVLVDMDASREVIQVNLSTVFNDMGGPGVYSIEYSPDGTRLVSGGDDGFVRIWDVKTGNQLQLLPGHGSIVLAVGWHPRFEWVVSSDESGAIRFWDAVSGRALDTLRGHDENVHALGFSALGDRLMSASRDRTVRVWDGQAGASDMVLEGLSFPNFGPYKAAFSPDGDRVVWRRSENALTVTDVRTGEDLNSRWTNDPFSVMALEFAEEGVWECENHGRITRWDALTGEELQAIDCGWFVWASDLQPEHRTALLVGADRDTAGATYTPQINPATYALERNPSNTARMKQIDLTSGSVRWEVALPLLPNRLSVGLDGSRALVAGLSTSGANFGLACFDNASGELLWQVWDIPEVHGLKFFPDGKRLAMTTYNGWDKTLFIRDVATGDLLESFVGHAQPTTLDISPDGSRIVTANWDGTMSLWSSRRGEILSLPGHSTSVVSVRFSPDGQTLASLGTGGRRRLWSASPVESRGDARQAAARRRRWSADARRRVDELLVSRVHPRAVVEALEADSSLRPEQRDAAILLVRSSAYSPSGTIQRSLQISLMPGRNGAEYMAALEGARKVVTRMVSIAALTPDIRGELAPDFAITHMAVAAAQLRLGLPREAIANLTLAEETLAIGVPWIYPPIGFLKAMVHHQLGDAQRAGELFEAAVLEVRIGSRSISADLAAFSGVLEPEVRALLGR